jgi:hypothetical protein
MVGSHWAVVALSADLGVSPWVERAASLGLAALVFGAMLACSGDLWRKSSSRRLRWDGSGWCLLQDQAGAPPDRAPEGVPRVMLDFGDWMLLHWRWRAADARVPAAIWLPLARADQPESWHRLRLALSGVGQVGSRAGSTGMAP